MSHRKRQLSEHFERARFIVSRINFPRALDRWKKAAGLQAVAMMDAFLIELSRGNFGLARLHLPYLVPSSCSSRFCTSLVVSRARAYSAYKLKNGKKHSTVWPSGFLAINHFDDTFRCRSVSARENPPDAMKSSGFGLTFPYSLSPFSILITTFDPKHRDMGSMEITETKPNEKR